jgi:hypothetical protein
MHSTFGEIALRNGRDIVDDLERRARRGEYRMAAEVARSLARRRAPGMWSRAGVRIADAAIAAGMRLRLRAGGDAVPCACTAQ